ncbi:hypothetical protein [Streptomyces spiramenti]|uniref:Uncharacterized protein n=1 Tax=Streptomyces spiramenti TaxID=2720606 RepID=A0ABX1AJS4_9ACTN|nr:hypothetical protein [Streptomyces spiramenti]NJP65340.1 hypothetical protein [Streptomyces spiramenti]
MITDLLDAWAVAVPVAATVLAAGVVWGARRYRAESSAREAALDEEMEHWVAVRLPAPSEAARVPEVEQLVPPAQHRLGATGDRLDQALAPAALVIARSETDAVAWNGSGPSDQLLDMRTLLPAVRDHLEAPALR